MTRCYEVVLTDISLNRKVSYLADTFSVNEDRILKIMSEDYGNVVIQMESCEELTINEIKLNDYREGLEYFK